MLETILKSIPHRPPFLFIDEVVEEREDGLTARRTWRADEPFYEGHYPGQPLTPGVLLCESVFQAGAVFLSRRESEGMTGRTPVLSRIEAARFRRMVLPGAEVLVEVTHKESTKGFHFMHGRVMQDGKTCLSLDFVLAMVEGPAV